MIPSVTPCRTQDLLGLRMSSSSEKDTVFGKTKDLLFDDSSWMIRYLVADTGTWLPKRRVLISPVSVGRFEPGDDQVSVLLRRELIENSPDLDEHAPVSREYEKRMFDRYRWNYYWLGDGLWGTGSYPAALMKYVEHPSNSDSEDGGALRSVQEVMTYSLIADDNRVGHIEDFEFNPRTWQIESLIPNTRDWLPGGEKNPIAMKHVTAIDFRDKLVRVDVPAAQILEE